jgi:hypothetical protein
MLATSNIAPDSDRFLTVVEIPAMRLNAIVPAFTVRIRGDGARRSIIDAHYALKRLRVFLADSAIRRARHAIAAAKSATTISTVPARHKKQPKQYKKQYSER